MKQKSGCEGNNWEMQQVYCPGCFICRHWVLPACCKGSLMGFFGALQFTNIQLRRNWDVKLHWLYCIPEIGNLCFLRRHSALSLDWNAILIDFYNTLFDRYLVQVPCILIRRYLCYNQREITVLFTYVVYLYSLF